MEYWNSFIIKTYIISNQNKEETGFAKHKNGTLNSVNNCLQLIPIFLSMGHLYRLKYKLSSGRMSVNCGSCYKT